MVNMKNNIVLILTRTIVRSSQASNFEWAQIIFWKDDTFCLAKWRFWRDNESLQWFHWERTFHFISSTVGLFWNCFDYQGLYFTKFKNSSQKHNFSLLQKPPGKILQFSEKYQNNEL